MKQETTELIEKAERAIQSAENTMNDGDYDFAVSRIYYAMFYIASALLGEKDIGQARDFFAAAVKYLQSK